jgi:hypothetical protein
MRVHVQSDAKILGHVGIQFRVMVKFKVMLIFNLGSSIRRHIVFGFRLKLMFSFSFGSIRIANLYVHRGLFGHES